MRTGSVERRCRSARPFKPSADDTVRNRVEARSTRRRSTTCEPPGHSEYAGRVLEGLSPLHLILILAIALIVLGPGKLPEAGAALGKAIRGFRDAAAGKDEPPPTP